MPNFSILDERRCLTPWNPATPEHKRFVAGRYGEIMGTAGKDVANQYIESYLMELEKFLEKYANSDMPPLETTEWDPREHLKQEVNREQDNKEPDDSSSDE